MSIDELERKATSRRSEWALAAASAAIVFLVVGLAATSSWRDRQGPPIQPPVGASRPESLLLQNPTRLIGGTVPFLPHLDEPVSYESLSFSPDGAQLATGGSDVEVVNVLTGVKRPLLTCPAQCSVSWSADGMEVVATQHSGVLRRIRLATGTETDVRLPAGWVADGLDVGPTGWIALAGSVDGETAIMTTDPSGAWATVTRRLGRTWAIDPRWSPDGTTIAYILRAAAFEDTRISALSLRTIAADGSHARTLAAIGSCACVGGLPGLDWSPGGRMAVVAFDTGSRRQRAAYEVDPVAGELTYIAQANGPLAWRGGR